MQKHFKNSFNSQGNYHPLRCVENKNHFFEENELKTADLIKNIQERKVS